MSAPFDISTSSVSEIQAMRDLFLAENKFQFVYDKCYRAGWADIFLVSHNNMKIGYGSVWGKDKREERDTVFDFFLVPPFTKYANEIFPLFIDFSNAAQLQCQTNDPLLSSMLFAHAHDIDTDAILFEDDSETNMVIEGAEFSACENAGRETEYQLKKDDIIVASGGFVWNYNFPYIDIYYAVAEGQRRKGYGSLFVQELKKEAYKVNRVPSARCNIQNVASRASLLKAGMRICGYMLTGKLKRKN